MKKLFFITWVTHNSRHNEKMKLLKVWNKEWYFLEDKNRVLLYNIIFNKIIKNWIKNFTLNVLSDHIHLVFMYEENDISEFIRKIKGGVSFEYSKIKKFSENWEWIQNKIWARWFSNTYLDTDEHYEKAIEYTLSNHIHHKISNIYPFVNRGL